MKNYLKKIKNSIKHWYLLAISGLIFIGVGIAAFATPLESYATLAVVFSLSFLITGISESVFAIKNRKSIDGWGWTLAGAILSVLMGVFLLIYPEISFNVLPFVAAFYLMFRSVQAIALSFDLKDYGILDWGNLLAVGILSLVISFVFLIYPVVTGISLVVLTGISFIVVGSYSVYYAFKLRKIKKAVNNIPKTINKKLNSLYDELKDIYDEVDKDQTATA